MCEGPYTVLVSGSNSWTPAGSQSACLGAAAAGRRVPAPPWLELSVSPLDPGGPGLLGGEERSAFCQNNTTTMQT